VASPHRSERPATSALPRISDAYRRVGSWLHGEALLVALLVASFIARWLLADRNSYWVDELYSVAVYGRWNDGALAAVNNLAENSVHPPLYQFVLYHWMNVFSDSEVATRSLSNLYVTLATLFLYLLVRDVFSRRAALASAVTFALMYLPLYYALETRSYAQTVFLVTLSSYLLLRIVRSGADMGSRAGTGVDVAASTDAAGRPAGGWRSAVLSPSAVLFTLTNVALLLTHYYNIFFWVAQAVVAAAFVLGDQVRCEGASEGPAHGSAGPPDGSAGPAPRAGGSRWRSLSVLVAAYVLQGAVFAAVWGRVFVDDFRRRSDDFAVSDKVQGVDELLVDQVVKPNIDGPRLVWWIGLACAAALLIRSLAVLVRGGPLTRDRRRAWTVVYLVAWLVLPLAIVYIAFSLAGVERYNMRYFLFSVVPLAPLVVLTVEEAGRLAGRAWRRFRGSELPAGVTTAAIVVVITTLVLPGAHSAATEPKADWRGNVHRIVDVIGGDEDSDYVVLEASHRRGSMANFYFERYSDEIRVHDVLAIDDERAGDGTHPVLVSDEGVIAEYDFLVVLFPHLVAGDFPNALEELDERYAVHHRQLDGAGRGFIVYEIHPD
ncbi:glycosyltransferase family 39 protein, partial [Phytoactinopolyspora endophytica]|uniref:glycosyltransferase family 39 protein n=1 Tax=Phytoactinopolyspora endophytica TaxID=1642495 RepID=UPI0013ECA4F5